MNEILIRIENNVQKTSKLDLISRRKFQDNVRLNHSFAGINWASTAVKNISPSRSFLL